MKKNVTTLISQPKIIIPAVGIIAIILGAILYPLIGNGPKVTLPISDEGASTTTISFSGHTDLAFPKSGRIESVYFKKGDTVKKGQVIAKLSAPDAEGLIQQTRGALALAKAQYASLDLTYQNTKKQQDVLVENAHQNLLKTTPEVTIKDPSTDYLTTSYPIPTISGNYTLSKEGVITIKTYSSVEGPAFYATGLVEDTVSIHSNPVPIGNSGLSILFPSSFSPNLIYTINIPNTHSPNYATNKNAYDLAVVTRDKILSELAANIGAGDSSSSVAKAQVDAAQGAYEAALGVYQSNVISAPADGVIDSIDENLQPGQSVTAGKAVVHMTLNSTESH